MTIRSTLLLLGLAGLAGIAQAQTPAPAPAPAAEAATKDVPIPAKEPPPPGDEGVPTVSIRDTDNGDRVEEYRQNGKVFMVKVTPRNGPEYYLYDDDGNGRLDRTDADGKLSPVYFVIYEWDASKPKPAKKD
jgi:hypothetical protein